MKKRSSEISANFTKKNRLCILWHAMTPRIFLGQFFASVFHAMGIFAVFAVVFYPVRSLHSLSLFSDDFESYSVDVIANHKIQITLNMINSDGLSAGTNWEDATGAGIAEIIRLPSGDQAFQLTKQEGAVYRVGINVNDHYSEKYLNFILRIRLEKGSHLRFVMQGHSSVGNPLAFSIELQNGLLKYTADAQPLAYLQDAWVTLAVLAEKNSACTHTGCFTVFLNNRQVGPTQHFIEDFTPEGMANGFITKGYFELIAGRIQLDSINSFRKTEPFTPLVSKQDILLVPNVLKLSRHDGIRFVGISSGTEIKITSSEGRRVFEDRALSGVYTFQGRDASGQKLPSGVYFVDFRAPDGHRQRSQFIIIR